MATVRASTPVAEVGFVSSRDSVEREAFKSFPYGLLVLDRDGLIVSRNAEAARLINELDLPEVGLTCCALLGCRRPDTVLANGCLTELALRHMGVLPEVRVDICTAAGPTAVWVGGGAVGRERNRVVLQLRAGIPRDRRQRTDPHWMVGPKLGVQTLGRTVVESAEGPIGGPWLDQRAGQVLKYLITERRRAVAIDEIGENIWTNADFAVGGSVRYHIHVLRRKLEPQLGSREPSAFIVARAGRYRLNLDQIELDADKFEADLKAGLAAVETDPQAAAELVERALAIYRGEFLADLPHAEWATAERNRLHDLASTGVRMLAEVRIKAHLFDGAISCLERLATLQPYDEDVHRRLIELEIMQGRRSNAVRHYAAFRSRIRRIFGHDPNFTPSDLAQVKLHA